MKIRTKKNKFEALFRSPCLFYILHAIWYVRGSSLEASQTYGVIVGKATKKTNVIPVFENEQTDCWQKIHRKYPQKKQRSIILKGMEVTACCCSLIAGKPTSKRTWFQSLIKNRQIAGIIHQRNLRNETKKHHPQTDGSNCLLLLIALQENVRAIINQAIVDCPAIRNHKRLLAFL
jgi:hypothetical protein